MGIKVTPEELAYLQLLPQEYLDEENGANRIVANDVGFLVAETIIFILYLSSRYLHNGARGIETRFLIPLAYLCNLGLVIGGPVAVNYAGAGYHLYALILRDPNLVTRYLQIQTATENLYFIAITCSKLAILVLYLKVFTDRLIRQMTWLTIMAVTLTCIGALLTQFLICRPYAFKWDRSINGTCGDVIASYRWVSLPNIITDLFILVLPLSTLYHLQMSKEKKFTVFLTFLIGGLGIVAAIIRFITFFEFDMTTDPTFLCTKTAITTDAEAGAYFICACFPGLRPLFQRIQKRLKASNFVLTYLRSKRSASASDEQQPQHHKGIVATNAPYLKTLHFSGVGVTELKTGTTVSDSDCHAV